MQFFANIFVLTVLTDLHHVSNCIQLTHCDEQQFRTLSCAHYTIFSVVKSDLFIRALLLDRILVTKKLRVHLVLVYLNILTQSIVNCNHR